MVAAGSWQVIPITPVLPIGNNCALGEVAAAMRRCKMAMRYKRRGRIGGGYNCKRPLDAQKTACRLKRPADLKQQWAGDPGGGQSIERKLIPVPPSEPGMPSDGHASCEAAY